MKIIPSQSAEEAHRAYLEANQNLAGSGGVETAAPKAGERSRLPFFLAALLVVAMVGGGSAYLVPFNIISNGESDGVSALLRLASYSSENSFKETLRLNPDWMESEEEVSRRLKLLDASRRSRLASEREDELANSQGEESDSREERFDSPAGGTGLSDRDGAVGGGEAGSAPDSVVRAEPPTGTLGRFQQFFALGLSEIRGNVFRISRTEISGLSRLQEGYIRRLAGILATNRGYDEKGGGNKVLGAKGIRYGRSQDSSPLSAWDLPLDQVTRTLKQSPWIEDVQVSVTYFPATLRLKIREAEPWLVVYMGGKTWLVSTLGQPLEALETLRDDEVILEASELPRLEGVDGGSQQAVNARFQYAVNILRLIEVAGGLPFAVDRYRLLEEGGVLATPSAGVDAPEVVLSAETLNQAEETLQKLKVVLDDLRNRGEVRTRVDMRFGGQAIVR